MKMLLALVLAFAPQFASAATLNGDNVTLTFNPINFVRTGTVGAGVDITQGNFLFDFNTGVNGDGFDWSSLPDAGALAGSTGMTLSSLDFSGGAVLSGFQVAATVLSGLTFSFTDHTLSFFWTTDPNSFPGPGGIISGTFLTKAANVPLPAALPLALTGIGVLGAIARRKKRAA